MRFSIRPSLQAYVLIGVTIALFLAATNIQAGWLYVMDSFLLSLLVFSLVISISQTNKLTFTRNFPKSIYEGDELEIQVDIFNTSKRLISFFEIQEDKIKRAFGENNTLEMQNKETNFFVELQPKTTISFKYKIKTELRGLYLFENFIFTSFGPFGLFKYSKTIFHKDELIVYPILPVINTNALSGSNQNGNMYSNKQKNALEATLPSNIREYRRGDSKKLIHWKSTAKQNKLMVKELESEQALSIQILFDTEKGNSCGLGKENNLEYLLKLAGGILKLCLDRHFSVEFLFFKENKLQKISNLVSNKQLLDTLATLETNSSYKMRDLLKEKDINHTSIIIPFFLKPEEKDIDTLIELYKSNYNIKPIFSEPNTFDSSYNAIIELASKSPFKVTIIKKGEALTF